MATFEYLSIALPLSKAGPPVARQGADHAARSSRTFRQSAVRPPQVQPGIRSRSENIPGAPEARLLVPGASWSGGMSKPGAAGRRRAPLIRPSTFRRRRDDSRDLGHSASTVRSEPETGNLQSATRISQPAFRNPKSAIRNPKSGGSLATPLPLRRFVASPLSSPRAQRSPPIY